MNDLFQEWKKEFNIQKSINIIHHIKERKTNKYPKCIL